jgi:hypothetical protein
LIYRHSQLTRFDLHIYILNFMVSFFHLIANKVNLHIQFVNNYKNRHYVPLSLSLLSKTSQQHPLLTITKRESSHKETLVGVRRFLSHVFKRVTKVVKPKIFASLSPFMVTKKDLLDLLLSEVLLRLSSSGELINIFYFHGFLKEWVSERHSNS